jgi:hypothetical protein
MLRHLRTKFPNYASIPAKKEKKIGEILSSPVHRNGKQDVLLNPGNQVSIVCLGHALHTIPETTISESTVQRCCASTALCQDHHHE